MRELARTLVARVRGEAPRIESALAFATQHATRGDPESVLSALDTYARGHRFLMNVGDEKGRILDEVVAALGPGARVLELGCFCGYSAIRIARLLDDTGRVVSIEVDPESVRVATQMLELAGLSRRVEIQQGRASDLIPSLEGPFDLVFLDHWKDLYEPDLKLIESSGLLRAGSTIVADNVGPLFGAQAYLAHVRECDRYESRYVAAHLEYHDQLEDGVEISVWNRASGAPARS
jgi:catechol O-methyltransferase